MKFHVWLMHLKVQEGKGKRKPSEERYINTVVTSPLRTGIL